MNNCHGIIGTSTPHQSETDGNVGRTVRRVQEGTPALLFQFGLDEKWCADFHGMLFIFVKKDLFAGWQNSLWERL